MKQKRLYLLITLQFFFSLGGCSAFTCPDCGKLLSNVQVDYQFHKLQILPDYRYYYGGELLEPYAVIGIHQDFTLEKGFWTEIDLTKKQLKEWMWQFSKIENNYDEDDRITINYKGAVIVNPEGKQVGVYFSKYYQTMIRFPAKNRIMVYKPEPPLISQVSRMREL